MPMKKKQKYKLFLEDYYVLKIEMATVKLVAKFVLLTGTEICLVNY